MAAREVVEYDAEFSRPSFQRRLVALCFSFFTWFMAWLVVLTVNLNYAVPRLDSPVADFGTFALLWTLAVAAPLTLAAGGSPGQLVASLEIVDAETSPPKPAGSVRRLVHLALFVVLLPVTWIPFAFGKSRTVHEMLGSTAVLQRDTWRRPTLGYICLAAPFVLILLALTGGLVAIRGFIVLGVIWWCIALAVPGLLVYGRGNQDPPDDVRRLDAAARLPILLRFDRDDVALNSHGRMSTRQRVRLLTRALAWIPIAIGCVCGPVVLIIILESGSADWNPGVTTLGKLGLMVLMVAIGGGWAAYRATIALVDAIRGSVIFLHTALEPHMDTGVTGAEVFRLTMNNQRDLRVWRPVYDAISTRTTYYVGYAPLSRQLLSVETASASAPVLEYREEVVIPVLRAMDAREPGRPHWVGWGLLFGIVATLDLLIGFANAGQFRSTAFLDVAAALLGYAPAIAWVALSNHRPRRRLQLWVAKGTALLVTLLIPWAIWIIMHGPPCPPNCGPGT